MESTELTINAVFLFNDSLGKLRVEDIPFTWFHSEDRIIAATTYIESYISTEGLDRGLLTTPVAVETFEAAVVG